MLLQYGTLNPSWNSEWINERKIKKDSIPIKLFILTTWTFRARQPPSASVPAKSQLIYTGVLITGYQNKKQKNSPPGGAVCTHTNKTTSHNRRARFVLCVCVCALIWWCVIKWRWSFNLPVYRDFLHFLKKTLLFTFCVHIYLSLYLYLSAHPPGKIIKMVFKQQKHIMFSGLTFLGLPSSSMIYCTYDRRCNQNRFLVQKYDTVNKTWK